MSQPDDTSKNTGEAQEQPAGDTFRSMLRGAVVLLLMLLMVAGFKSYRDLTMVRAQEAELQQSITQTQANIRILTERVGRIREDPTMLEQLAREELGWVRARDMVIVLPDEPVDGAEQSTAQDP